MANFFTLGSVFTFLGCLSLGVLYAWLLYGTHRNLAKRLKVTLFALRVLIVTIVAWLIFAPLIKVVSYTPEKPIVVLAHDNSISVSHIQGNGFNKTQYEKDLQTLASRLSDKYDVKIFNFSDSVNAGFNFTRQGKLSNASALIDRLNDELLNRNVGGVILASDGIFNRGGNPLYEIDKIKAPFYTIALGDTIPKRDLLVANVNYNNLVYLDNDFTLDVEIQAYDSKGETSQLNVFENGKKIKEVAFKIDAGSFVKVFPLKIKANKIGVQQYTVTVTNLKNEITVKNNSQTVFIEVIDARQKILLAAAAPHPDLATLRQAIERNQHYEVTLAIDEELEGVDVTKFSLAILYQLPHQRLVAAPLISRLTAAKISSWYVLGAQTNVNAFNQVQKKINLSRSGGSIQEVFPYRAPNFTVFNLEENALAQLNSYDPLEAPFGTLNVNGSYTAVLNQRIGKINTPHPMLFFMEDQSGKTGVLLGEGIWKWKLEEAKDEKNYPLIQEIISKTVQYLSVKDDKRRFKVYTSKSTFEENEAIILNATLYNDAYEAVNSPDAKVQLKNAAGKLFNYTFSKFGAGYRLDAGMLPAGKYTYTASVTLGANAHQASGAFFVNSIVAEYQQTTANHQLLYTIAKQSNGKLFAPQSLLSIADEIEKSGQAKTISYEDRRYDELVSMKWLFIMIIALLTLEWFLRKRNGEV